MKNRNFKLYMFNSYNSYNVFVNIVVNFWNVFNEKEQQNVDVSNIQKLLSTYILRFFNLFF